MKSVYFYSAIQGTLIGWAIGTAYPFYYALPYAFIVAFLGVFIAYKCCILQENEKEKT